MKNMLSTNLKTITSYVLTLTIVILGFGFVPVAQADITPTLTIGSQTASNGDSIVVPIVGSNFTTGADIAALQFRVNYDTALLSFTGYTGAITGVTTIGNPGSYVTIVWDNSSALLLNNETFVSLKFNVISGDS